jgi:hypothetical protein
MSVPTVKLDIYAHRRSGHHAIIFWIINNFGGFTETYASRVFYNKETGLYFYNDNSNYEYSLLPYEHKIEIRNYEDVLPTEPKKIIIMRDFLNTLASRLSHIHLQKQTNIAEVIKLWKSFCQLILTGDYYPILYNKWLMDKDYRDSIAKELGSPNLDDRSYVNDNAGKSSYTGVVVESNPKEYLERYKKLRLTRTEMELISTDKELETLNQELFEMSIAQQLKEVNYTNAR